ncbi:hypothetical protein DWW96_02790 [Eubacterium sp. AF17-7]|uniref:hypothetical protein n=1 Tax=Eubacterium sp. AF17-7 TaxID=2293105 RepID=UPI000E4B7F23|nr:hypothetical protein [Eubacterium sp. AF17-7]RGG67600.1 hypothetical protein DWW96_02790 [Eubacterium sp. AF17-7]
MEFEFNREKSSFIKVLKGKCEKNALKCSVEDNKIMIETFANSEGKLEDTIPAVFKGTIEAKENKTLIKGRFTNGFYLTTLVAVAAILIIARLSWSIYQKQLDNIIMCAIATAILVIVCVVVNIKGKKSKERIITLLKQLQ